LFDDPHNSDLQSAIIALVSAISKNVQAEAHKALPSLILKHQQIGEDNVSQEKIKSILRQLLPESLQELSLNPANSQILHNLTGRFTIRSRKKHRLPRIWQSAPEKFLMLYNEFFEPLGWNREDLLELFLGEGKFSGKKFVCPWENRDFAYLFGSLGFVGKKGEKKNKTIYIYLPHYWVSLSHLFISKDNGLYKPSGLRQQYHKRNPSSDFGDRVDKFVRDLEEATIIR
jgi:hypothetical protein